MSSTHLVTVENVAKKFCRSLKRSMFYGISDITRELMGFSVTPEPLRHGEFWALEDVSFGLSPGECLGVIGHNGAGKSTLLKLLSGIYPPDKGQIHIRGRVGTLIEVGAGFHPLLSGRENIYINGSILGMKKAEIDRKFDEIVAFSGIEEFLDTPIKYYSNGMHVRLGFSIATHASPDILLVDEVLAVGDIGFQAKCLQRMSDLKQQGVAMIIVSHQLTLLQKISDLALAMTTDGVYGPIDVPEAIDIFRSRLISRNSLPGHIYERPDISIKQVEINVDNETNNSVSIDIHYRCTKQLAIHAGVAIHNLQGDQLIVCRSDNDKLPPFITELSDGGTLALVIPQLPLTPGVYLASIRLYDDKGIGHLANHEKAYTFAIEGGAPAESYFHVDHSWRQTKN